MRILHAPFPSAANYDASASSAADIFTHNGQPTTVAGRLIGTHINNTLAHKSIIQNAPPSRACSALFPIPLGRARSRLSTSLGQ